MTCPWPTAFSRLGGPIAGPAVGCDWPSFPLRESSPVTWVEGLDRRETSLWLEKSSSSVSGSCLLVSGRGSD